MIPPDDISPTSMQTEQPWHLRLFVAKQSAASATAIVQIRRIMSEYLPQYSRVEIIDLFDQPEMAEQDQVIAIPTLIRKRPEPVRRVIGDLSEINRVLTSIGFSHTTGPGSAPG